MLKKIAKVLNGIAKYFQTIWDKIPGVLKAIVYVTIASLLAEIQTDLLDIEVNKYIAIGIVGLNDAILYLIQELTKKAK